MQHDCSDQSSQQALLYVFNPGSGVEPPLLAGREQPLAVLDGLLGRMANKKQIPCDAVLYGPRGNGKTALLGKFVRQVGGAVSVVGLLPALLRSQADLASQLLHYDDESMAGLMEAARPFSAELGIPGIGKIGWQGLSQDEKDNLRQRSLPGLVQARCNKVPLLVVVDEAHTLNIEVGQTLLNLSQEVRTRGAPFLLVLAGTPNLEAHLRRMSATFWSRSEQLAIGRLSQTATEDALVKPLAEYDITFAKDALATVTADSQRYPYFVQLCGHALCQVLVRDKTTHITMDTVKAAYPALELARAKYYKDRYEEIKEQNLLGAADWLAGVFSADQKHNYDLLEAHLADSSGIDPEQARAQLEQLSHLGYIWRPADDSEDMQACEAGIPSLMTHVQKQVELGRRPLP